MLIALNMPPPVYDKYLNVSGTLVFPGIYKFEKPVRVDLFTWATNPDNYGRTLIGTNYNDINSKCDALFFTDKNVYVNARVLRKLKLESDVRDLLGVSYHLGWAYERKYIPPLDGRICLVTFYTQ